MDEIGITGATGILGKILVAKLEKDGLEYCCFNGDIRQRNDIKTWLKENQFSAIIHFAAIVPTAEVKADPEKAREVNVDGTRNLIDGIKSSGRNPWLFYASTSHVYKSKDTPINEEDATKPISIYGKTKHEAEKIVVKEYENACVGRIFSFYHDSQERPFLYPNMLYRLEHENLSGPFELYGANSVRDFLNAEDVVDAVVDLMSKRITGVYNIASGHGIKIGDFVQNLTDKELDIREMGGQDYLVADISKLNKVLGR